MKRMIKNFISILMFGSAVLINKSAAQTPSWQWAKSAGLTGSEMTMGTAVDAGGNVYAIGWYTSANITFGATTLVNPGSGTSDMFLTKYDPTGNVLWAKTYGGIDGELGNGVAVDASGNVYVTGWFTSPSIAFGTYTLTNTGTASSDIFIAKINSGGNTVWAKSAGGTSADRGYDITVDASGNVFTTGGFGSPSINFGTGSLTNSGTATNDFFIAKHDAVGNALWAHNAGGTTSDVGYSIATDSLGSAYVTGIFTSTAINFGTGVLTNSAPGTQDLFVAKYNGSGTAIWSQRAGGNMDDFGNGIAVFKNSVYVTGGYSSSTITFSSTTLANSTPGTSDFVLAKYDLNGNGIWAKKAGGTDSDAGTGVDVDAAGNVFVSGYFASTNLSFGTTTVNNFSAGYKDLFVAAFDGAGSSLWAAEAGDAYDEIAYSVSVKATGGDVYIGGTFNSPSVTFGTNMIYKGCGDDVLVAKIQGPLVGIKEEYLTNRIDVYPNPTNGKFRVEAEGQITFYNAIGEIILTEKLNEKNNFDFSSQPKGVYLYCISSDKKGTSTGKVVVE